VKHEAIYALYPSVITIDDGAGAFDSQGNAVQIDEALVDAWKDPNTYKSQRQAAYPPITDYLDGIVKGDQEQVANYIADCQAVKARYPKGA
jgi:hypothetical protein